MPYRDSLDKIVKSYFAVVTAEPFTYKGEEYEPKPIVVSPLIFRGYTCPPNCGGCCYRFSLVYLPGESFAPVVEPRTVEFNGDEVTLFEDPQTDHDDHHCRYLRKTDGRCSIYNRRPFTCDFELIRSRIYEDKNYLNAQLFGRGWAFSRVDGEKGAKCEMLPPTQETTSEVVRKLKRLKDWTDHFSLRTCLPTVIAWAETGPHDDFLRFHPADANLFTYLENQNA